jgi:hypothetical protein
MRTTVLAANDLPGGTVVEGPIKLRLPARDNRRKNIRAATTSLALILVPAQALAYPLVTLPAPPFEVPVLPPVSLDGPGAVWIAGPSQRIDDSLSLSSGDPAQNEKLHGLIIDLVARSLEATLSDMHLADLR